MGCGGSGNATAPRQPPQTADAEPPASPVSTQSAQQPADTSSPTAQAQGLVRTDQKGRKWIDDIPYDVWFEDPLAVAAKGEVVPDGGPGASPSDANGGSTAAEASLAAISPSSAATLDSSRDWSALMPVQVLEDEVKRIRNQLTAGLQSVGRYNSNLKELQIAGAELAALAGIGWQHAEPTSWKDSAPLLQTYGAAIEQASQETGRTAYDAARSAFESAAVLLDGGQPAEQAVPPADNQFAASADRTGLMKRMDRAFKWLRGNVATEKDLQREQANTLHEGAILAALAAVIATDGYTSADEPPYQGHAGGLISDSSELTAAVRDADFAKFNDTLTRIEKRCNDCHREYRFEE
jgi:hypothetical protein